MEVLIYILDDYKPILDNIAELFNQEGIMNYTTFDDPDKFLAALKPEVQVCIIDFKYPGRQENGIDIMRKVKEKNSYCKIIIISAQIDIMQYSKVTNENAYKFLEKTDSNFSDDLVYYTKMAINEAKNDFDRIGKLYEKYKNNEKRY